MKVPMAETYWRNEDRASEIKENTRETNLLGSWGPGISQGRRHSFEDSKVKHSFELGILPEDKRNIQILTLWTAVQSYKVIPLFDWTIPLRQIESNGFKGLYCCSKCFAELKAFSALSDFVSDDMQCCNFSSKYGESWRGNSNVMGCLVLTWVLGQKFDPFIKLSDQLWRALRSHCFGFTYFLSCHLL